MGWRACSASLSNDLRGRRSSQSPHSDAPRFEYNAAIAEPPARMHNPFALYFKTATFSARLYLQTREQYDRRQMSTKNHGMKVGERAVAYVKQVYKSFLSLIKTKKNKSYNQLIKCKILGVRLQALLVRIYKNNICCQDVVLTKPARGMNVLR